MRKEEEVRIARETVDQRGFLPRLERLLLAADESPVGRMAARLGGMLAGAQGMPVTVLKLEGRGFAARAEDVDSTTPPAPKMHSPKQGTAEPIKDTDSKKLGEEETPALSRTESGIDLQADPLAKEVKAGAKKSAAKVIADEAEPDPEKVHITARIPVDSAAAVVKDEARKGYDLMLIGLEASIEADGGFAPKITELAAGFEGPLLIFAGQDNQPLNRRTRLLVPVNGSTQSRRAAEIAFALARATGATVHALFVSQTDGHSRTRLREESVLKDMVELGERYDVSVRTRISPRSAAAQAILKEAGRNFAMIVMGASARPGEELFLGNTAGAVLKDWKGPTLLLAS